MKNYDLVDVKKSRAVRVKCFNEDGVNYFVIYEVVAFTLNGHKVVTGRYLNEQDAEQSVDFNRRLKSLYKLSYYSKKFVWC